MALEVQNNGKVLVGRGPTGTVFVCPNCRKVIYTAKNGIAGVGRGHGLRQSCIGRGAVLRHQQTECGV